MGSWNGGSACGTSNRNDEPMAPTERYVDERKLVEVITKHLAYGDRLIRIEYEMGGSSACRMYKATWDMAPRPTPLETTFDELQAAIKDLFDKVRQIIRGDSDVG